MFYTTQRIKIMYLFNTPAIEYKFKSEWPLYYSFKNQKSIDKLNTFDPLHYTIL